MGEISITIDINKLIDKYQFNEELVKKMYNNDYKQLALDLAKENQKLAFKNLKKENIIKEVREYIDRRDIEWGSEEHNHVLEILDKENK